VPDHVHSKLGVSGVRSGTTAPVFMETPLPTNRILMGLTQILQEPSKVFLTKVRSKVAVHRCSMDEVARVANQVDQFEYS
jgi:hypothetical protein